MQMSELEAANAELEDANTQMEAVIMRRDELEAQFSSQIASLTSELRQSQASFLNSHKPVCIWRYLEKGPCREEGP